MGIKVLASLGTFCELKGGSLNLGICFDSCHPLAWAWILMSPFSLQRVIETVMGEQNAWKGLLSKNNSKYVPTKFLFSVPLILSKRVCTSGCVLVSAWKRGGVPVITEEQYIKWLFWRAKMWGWQHAPIFPPSFPIITTSVPLLCVMHFTTDSQDLKGYFPIEANYVHFILPLSVGSWHELCNGSSKVFCFLKNAIVPKDIDSHFIVFLDLPLKRHYFAASLSFGCLCHCVPDMLCSSLC